MLLCCTASFQLGKFHRDVAALLTKTAAAASDAQPIIKVPHHATSPTRVPSISRRRGLTP